MSNWWMELKQRAKESVTWLSVQITAGWGAFWVIYSQLPTDTVVWLSEHHITAYLGIGQTVSVYLGRLKKQKGSKQSVS